MAFHKQCIRVKLLCLPAPHQHSHYALYNIKQKLHPLCFTF